MLYPVWPASLTDASWQKKKGSIAKIAGETGVGEAMKAGKALFDKLDFNSMEASQIPPGDRNEEDLEEKKQAVLEWHKKSVEPVRTHVKEIIDAATKAAISWKKNKLIPKDSVKAAEDVASEANLFHLALKSNSVFMTNLGQDYDRMIDICRRTEAAERLTLSTAVANLKKALQEVVANPTKAQWESANTSAHQRCRSMCNAIKGIPSLKKQYFTEWQPYGNFYAKSVVAGSPTEKADVIQLVKNVGASLKKFESTYQAHL